MDDGGDGLFSNVGGKIIYFAPHGCTGNLVSIHSLNVVSSGGR